MKIILGYILTYIYILGVLGISTILKNKMKEETSRKIVHILVGLSWFIMVYFFGVSIHLIIPPLTFIFINYLSYKHNIIKAMERENKESRGTIYFALSFFLLALITTIYPKFLPFYGIGVLSMTLADGLAPFVGQKFNKQKVGNTNKTYSGSLTIFIITFVICVVFNLYFNLNISVFKLILLSFSAVILELIGKKGIDNLTLPIGLACISYLLTL